MKLIFLWHHFPCVIPGLKILQGGSLFLQWWLQTSEPCVPGFFVFGPITAVHCITCHQVWPHLFRDSSISLSPVTWNVLISFPFMLPCSHIWSVLCSSVKQMMLSLLITDSLPLLSLLAHYDLYFLIEDT